LAAAVGSTVEVVVVVDVALAPLRGGSFLKLLFSAGAAGAKVARTSSGTLMHPTSGSARLQTTRTTKAFMR
jgi:hypothetical protein